MFKLAKEAYELISHLTEQTFKFQNNMNNEIQSKDIYENACGSVKFTGAYQKCLCLPHENIKFSNKNICCI